MDTLGAVYMRETCKLLAGLGDPKTRKIWKWVNWKHWVAKWGTQLGYFFGWLSKLMTWSFFDLFWQAEDVTTFLPIYL